VGRQQRVCSVEQLCRWILFSLRWPEAVRWLRRYPTPPGATTSPSLAVLEQLGASCPNLEKWQKEVGLELRLKLDQTPWLLDESLLKFFKKEASSVRDERLSACCGTGLW